MNEGAEALHLVLEDMRVTIGGGITKPACQSRIETACHY